MVRFNELLPPEISAPRVRFEQDRVLLGFHIRRGMWRGVVSSRIHAWVSGPNQLALDIETAELGMIPVPVDEFLAGLVQKLKAAGWTLEWKHNGARDVLVVTINSGDGSDSENRAALESMEINPGVLRISGRRTSRTEPLSDATTDAKAG